MSQSSKVQALQKKQGSNILVGLLTKLIEVKIIHPHQEDHLRVTTRMFEIKLGRHTETKLEMSTTWIL